MGFLSDLIRAPIGQAPSRGRGMGGLEPRRKGGLAGLLRKGIDKRLERPMPIGGVGGGVGITKSPLQQAFEKIQNQIQPVPILPNQQGMRFDPITRKMVPAEGPDMSGKIPVPSIPSVTPPPLFESLRGITKRPEEQMFIERLDNEPLRDLTNNFVPPALGRTPDPVPLPTQTPIAPPPVDRPILQRPIIPPRRDDFMSIAQDPNSLPYERSVNKGPFDLPEADMSGKFTDISDNFVDTNPFVPDYGFGPGIMPPTPDFTNDITGGLDPNPGLTAVTPPVQPAPTEPAAVATTAGADPSQTQMPMGAIDPVLLQQQTSEKLTDPLLRSLYFGTQDSPGFYQQLQQAGANLIGSDVPLQQTAGLSPLELLARQQAVAGLGGFEPFLQQNRDLVDQAIAQSRRAEELQDPYYTQAEEIYKDTMGAYDPSMTQQFYNPYEDAVVQQTIEDVMKAGDKQDIAERAREISAGAFGGSRARLGAEERRQDLGEGLAKALSGIRQTGYQSAQATGLGEFARQQAAKRTGAEGLMGIGIGRGSAASQLGSQLAGYGSQIGGIGSTQEGLRAGQRGELSGYGGVGRGIAETGLGRIFEQQVGQQYRPMQTLGQIGSMLPGYQASQTQIDSGYGMPTDPSAAGLGAAFSAYGALAPRQEGQG